jgi:hypothetical protein
MIDCCLGVQYFPYTHKMNTCTNNESDTKKKSRERKTKLSISYLYCQGMPRCSLNPFKTIINIGYNSLLVYWKIILNVAFSLMEWDSVLLYSNIQLANFWLFKVQRLNSTYSISNSTKGVFNPQGAWRPLEKLILHVFRSSLFLSLLHCQYNICLLFNLFFSRYGTTIWYCVPLLEYEYISKNITLNTTLVTTRC